MRFALRKILAALLCVLMLLGSFTALALPGVAVIAGDINNDGDVNNKDLTRLFQYLSEWDVTVNENVIDVNGDGDVNNKDLTRLFQYLSEWDVQIHPQFTCDHDGETEIRNAYEPTCGEDGYTGDTYCLICNQKIATGEIIPATGLHFGGVATCHTLAVCVVCGKEYGEYNHFIHSGGIEYRNGYAAGCDTVGYTGDKYCIGCGEYLGVGEEISPTGHKGGTATCHTLAICEVCGNTYGDYDYTNHTGGTEIRYAIPASCNCEGYTGDTYCLGCNAWLAAGESLPMTEHTVGDWLRDNEEHWHVCSGCSAIMDREAHSFSSVVTPPTCTEIGFTKHTCKVCGLYYVDDYVGTTGHTGGVATCHTLAVCEVCGNEYGNYDYDNHDGGTEIWGAYPAGCVDNGYTGNIYCLGCGNMISEGEMIPATGHDYIGITTPATCTTVGYTEYTCSVCGGNYVDDYVYPIGHTGGVATCHSAAICTVCGTEYGGYDPENHDGGVTVEDASEPNGTEPGYSGNEICLGCGAVLSYGEYYLSEHTHEGGVATYYQKAICSHCRKEYGGYAQMRAYDELSDNQKGIYRVIENMVSNLDLTRVSVFEYCDANTYADDISVAFRALSDDRPDMFWMPKTVFIPYTYNKFTGEKTNIFVTFASKSLDPDRGLYGVTVDEKNLMAMEIEETVANIVSGANEFDTDFEKELYVHDRLCDLIYYDYWTAGIPDANTGEYPPEDYYDRWAFTTYGALVEGSAVCEGYSRAMQLICQRLGIPCGLVTGYGGGGAHMWNIINPGDGCYYLDVTFDDIEGYEIPCIHTYFNQTKEFMEDDHEFYVMFETDVYYDEYNFLDTHGDNTALSYLNVTGAYIDSTDAQSAADYVMRMYNAGHTQFAVAFDTDYGYSDAFNALRKALSDQLKLSDIINLLSNNILVINVLEES